MCLRVLTRLCRGSGLLSRFYTWRSEFLLAAIFIAVGYIEPTGAPLDLDGINALTTQLFGYTTYGYMKLFNSEEAGTLLDSRASTPY